MGKKLWDHHPSSPLVWLGWCVLFLVSTMNRDSTLDPRSEKGGQTKRLLIGLWGDMGTLGVREGGTCASFCN